MLCTVCNQKLLFFLVGSGTTITYRLSNTNSYESILMYLKIDKNILNSKLSLQ